MGATRELCVRLSVFHRFITRHHHRHQRNFRSHLDQVTVGIYLRRGLIQSGKRISVEVLLTGFIFRITWSCPVCGSVNQDYRRKCSTRDCPRESLGSDATLVEEGAVAKTEEQERLKALDASIVNLEKEKEKEKIT